MFEVLELGYQCKSLVFDGSATSMSGNGAFLQHNGSFAGAGQIFLPSEQGGGCVTSGPFKEFVHPKSCSKEAN
jgi:hypothetical protein